MQPLDDLAPSIRRRRRVLGLTQSVLADRAGLSLATIQNVEAGRANPSLSTLSKILAPLGLEIDVRAEPADWDALAGLGVPLTASAARPPDGSPPDLRVHVRRAAFELRTGDGSRGGDRRREALQAFLLALKTHFPSRYAAWFVDCPEVLDLVPSAPSGRVIKLTRVAKERLAGLL